MEKHHFKHKNFTRVAMEQKEIIKLVPVKEKRKRFSKLFGMLENSTLSTKEFCKQKQIDKISFCGIR